MQSEVMPTIVTSPNTHTHTHTALKTNRLTQKRPREAMRCTNSLFFKQGCLLFLFFFVRHTNHKLSQVSIDNENGTPTNKSITTDLFGTVTQVGRPRTW